MQLLKIYSVDAEPIDHYPVQEEACRLSYHRLQEEEIERGKSEEEECRGAAPGVEQRQEAAEADQHEHHSDGEAGSHPSQARPEHHSDPQVGLQTPQAQPGAGLVSPMESGHHEDPVTAVISLNATPTG